MNGAAIRTTLTTLFALTLAACSGGGGDGTSPAPVAGPPAPAPAPAPAPSPAPAPGGVITPDTPPASDVSFTIRSDQGVKPISPFIYGANNVDFSKPRTRHLALGRSGGNRLTAYNWENNASNAGSDWFHQNDGLISSSDTPGVGITDGITAAFANNVAMVVTVPTIGYVAADKNGGGDVAQTPNYLQVRFRQSVPKKNAPFTTTPDTGDAFVYQDEWVHFLKLKYPTAFSDARKRLFFSLDNEPDLWAYTHARLRGSTGTQGAPLTYAEIVRRSTDYAAAIKDVAPAALVFGPVNYGWAGMTGLQGASDAQGRDFLDFYLAQMKARETSAGRRLLDVLDFHWYPEDRGGGVRVTGTETDAAVVAARLNAPRSLWDASFTEPSWIGANTGPVQLLRRMQAKIDALYPGTKLAITEYNYGGNQHISGGIAQADVLGIFGREGLFAAAFWPLADNNDYTWGGFEMFRNFDGAGGAFGDTSIQAQGSDTAQASVYASVDAANPNRLVVVAINRSAAARTAAVRIWHTVALGKGRVYALTAASSQPQAAAPITLSQKNALQLSLPPLSVSTLVLTP